MKFEKQLSSLLMVIALGSAGGLGGAITPACAKAPPPINTFDGGSYRVELKDRVRVKIGGAVKVFNRSQLNHNQRVGRHQITPEQFAKISSAIPKTYSFKVNPRKLGPLQEIYLSSDSSPSKKGLYNWKKRQFLFAEFKKPVRGPGGKSGVIRGTSVKGLLSKNHRKIRDGEITSGFLAAGKGIAIGAEITFFFVAKKI